MRELVRSYLQKGLNRRGFVERMVQSGFSLVAANAVLASLAPAFAQDDAKGGAKPYTRTFRGTGGELLAEQLREAGVEYLFLGNGTGVSPLCDAVVDRPEMKIILAVHEGLCVAMADGYSKAARKPAFSMFSRVGVPNASSNMYNAMKDRSQLVIASDHIESLNSGASEAIHQMALECRRSHSHSRVDHESLQAGIHSSRRSMLPDVPARFHNGPRHRSRHLPCGHLQHPHVAASRRGNNR